MLRAIKQHNSKVLNNAKNVRIQSFNVGSGYDSDGDYYVNYRANCLGSTIPRKVEVRIYKDSGKGVSSKGWVSCSCPYFLFHCEVALSEDESSSVLYSNGAAPSITNPSMIPVICKHIIAVLTKGKALELKPKNTIELEKIRKKEFEKKKK
jgi:hypothetical protein